ncbi:NlpC/P60 family protein [Streptomyces sp. NPDC050610]|uniref:C40 family peptidase n=1 Tax=Streptomyces sp. NPDC050610 TaxID=3157097 RepID=UPI0034292901
MSGRFVRSVCTAAVVATAAFALPAPMAFASPKAPPDAPVSELLTQLQTLYQKAEEATEKYNGTEEKLKKQRARVDKLDSELADVRVALANSKNDAGRLAREQYRGGTGALSPYVRFLLSRDPQEALDQGHQLKREAGRRAAMIERLTGGEQQADQLATDALAALDVQETLAATQKKQRDTVKQRLDEVEQMLASLTGDQLAELQRLEQKDIGAAQDKLLASGSLGGSSRAPSKDGEAAVAYAFKQLGKPYVWGATGPDSFDCSGLTSQAWAHAGDPIPRTSQEQWKSLPRVPLNELRPGDLVVYFKGATHVAMYIGDGLVVQAPRPGAKVKVSPIAANPLLGAVRPDQGKEPVKGYKPPKLPAGAANGSDTGYGSAGAPKR